MASGTDLHWKNGFPWLARAAAFGGLLAGALALAPADPPRPGELLKGKAAFGDWKEDQPGVRRLIRPEDLPAKGPGVPNQVKVVPRTPDAKPRVPAGFRVELVAGGSSRSARDPARAERRPLRRRQQVEHDSRLPRPARVREAVPELHVREGPAPAVRHRLLSGRRRAPVGVRRQQRRRRALRVQERRPPGERPSREDHPAHPWSHHWTRDIVFTPDGKKLFYSVGSGSNVAQDMFPQPHEEGGVEGWAKAHPLGATWDTEERRANVLTFDPTA
jgi:glucose/arabinose dehydrogenase